jgi:hypothetical protein
MVKTTYSYRCCSFQRRRQKTVLDMAAEYRIEYKINSDGDFIVAHLEKDNKRRKLREIEEIEKERIDNIRGWETLKKLKFTLLDLSIDQRTIELAAQNSNYKLNFALPDEIVLDVDSFDFCQNYKMTKSISTGGEKITVTMLSKSLPTAEFIFDSKRHWNGSVQP